MDRYNKTMLYMWLVITIVSTIIVTYMLIKEGADRWLSSYILPAIALLMYFVRRWMMKRMKRHMDYLNNQNQK